MSKLSIIIPIYFNADSLMLCYKDIKEKVLQKIEQYELVLVDDGSKDDSWIVMKEIAAMDPNVKLIKLSRNFGSHAAILAGLEMCGGDCATLKAADLQEPSEMILEMYERWKKGNKVVLAVREDREESFSQKAFANLYYYLVRKFAISSMPKGGFDCYLIDRKVIEVLKLLDERNSAITLQVLWAGFQTDTVTYIRKERQIGKSRWTLSKKVKLTIDSLVSFSFAPIRFMSFIGALFSFVSIIWGIVLIINKLFGKIDIEGWTTLMLIVLFSSGIIMFTLGILGEYIWRSMDASRNRPVFIIDEMEKEKYDIEKNNEVNLDHFEEDRSNIKNEDNKNR